MKPGSMAARFLMPVEWDLSLVRKPLGDQSGMEYAALLPSALANDGVAIFHLAGIDIVDLLVTVKLTDPFRRTVVFDGHFSVARPRLADGDRGFIRIAPCDNAFPSARFGGFFFAHCVLREPRC